jgi:hydrogenase maturation factor
MGKPVTEELKKLLNCIGKDSDVLVPPMPGYDSGVHEIDGKYLVVSTDPCIGVPEEWFGWLLIHYAASDVALFGAHPRFCTINLLGPPSTKPQTFQKIMKHTCSAAKELQIAIVTGHTGTYKGLSTLVGVCTAYGTVNKSRLITPGGAKPGDHIFCIKPIGLEVAVNFASSNKKYAEELFGVRQAQKLTKLVQSQSCVKEALLLAEIEGVHAMHDATEGGLTAALNEMAEASHVGFKVEFAIIPIPKEVHKLQELFRLSDEQMLSMSSTGTIIAAVNPAAKDKVEKTLRQHGIEANSLGCFSRSQQRIMLKNERKMLFPSKVEDPYERILFGKV